MKATVISIGDEILIGQIVDTNSVFISKELNKIGVEVSSILTIGDSQKEIISALNHSKENIELIILTGGLADLYKNLPEYYSSSKFGINQNNSEHALFQHLSDTKVAHFVLNNALELNCKFVKRKDGSDEDVPMLVSVSSLELIRDNNPDEPPLDWRNFV